MDLRIKYAQATDDLFTEESKMSLVTNTNYNWSGAHTVRIFSYMTTPLNDYKRNSSESDPVKTMTRYGELYDLNSQIQEMVLSKDRSFIFNIDRLDSDESEIEAGKALARELREVVIPEVDNYVYNKIIEGAGNKAQNKLTKDNIYQCIVQANEVLDLANVPDTERKIVVTPSIYSLLKIAKVFDNVDVGAELRLKGVIGMIDGVEVIKINASKLPQKFGFLVVHPSATTAVTKLEDYNIHSDTPLASGDIVTGRICYDAFVLNNKKSGIYYHENAEA
ncbi:hypothetical protein [Peptoanaerobacter stomatis]|uniref:hypothetical protein n=1 Tax=Peptoanaerobacter stomatis TaxID=796937 RepID=UPI003FA103E3